MQADQRTQDRYVRGLADQPGLHAENRNRQRTAQAYVQLLSVLSTVQNSAMCFATTPARLERRILENRIARADVICHQHCLDEAIRRESGRNNNAADREQDKAAPFTGPDPLTQQAHSGNACAGQTVPDSAPSATSASPPGVQKGGPRSDRTAAPDMAPRGGDRQVAGTGVTGVSDVAPRPMLSEAGGLAGSPGTWWPELRGPLLFAQAAATGHAIASGKAARPPVLLLNGTLMHDFLAAFIGGEDGRFMAGEIGKVTAGRDMMLELVPPSRMDKRAAIAQLEAQENALYHAYLQNNCHIRTKTVHGDPIGDNLLVAGEYLRNPWRGITENINNLIFPDSPLSEVAETVTEYVNLGADIVIGFFTGGAYPIFKYGTSKSMTVAGQAVNGDQTCLKREFSPEELARLLFDTEVGVTHHQPFPQFHHKPVELAGARPFKPSGLFVEQYLPSGIYREKYMAINKDGTEILIREKQPGEFVTHHPHAASPEQLERPVFFDAQSQKIHVGTDRAAGPGHDFHLVEGRQFVDIRGERCELLYNPGNRRLEIQVEHGDVSSRVPVYKERLSHTWHLGVHNGNPVFSAKQASLLDRMKIHDHAGQTYLPIRNFNADAYGSGNIVEVRKAGALPSDAPNLLAIEMHGVLVPVRMRPVRGHGVRLEAFHPSAPRKRGRLVEWDGLRWLFDRRTSVHVDSSLRRAVDASLFDRTISAHALSAPDRRGVRWDRFDRGFLKIKNGFVRVHQYAYDPDAWFIAHGGKKTNLFYDNSRFRVESVMHRLQRLHTQGMSGRGAARAFKKKAAARKRGGVCTIRKDDLCRLQNTDVPGAGDVGAGANAHAPGTSSFRSALTIIEDCYGFTPQEATRFLGQYRFEENSLFNIRAFALHIESYGVVPRWAKRIGPDGGVPSGAIRQVPASGPVRPPGRNRVMPGERLHDGDKSTVFADAEDASFVIKKLKADYFFASGGTSRSHRRFSLKNFADREVQLFNRYYGAGMARRIVQDGEVFVRMPKVPGKPLRSLEVGEMPADGMDRFLDMLEKLADVGIWHGDLRAGNVLFDPTDQMFYPIDFSNLRGPYLRATGRKKEQMNVRETERWNSVMRMINEKTADLAASPI